jgi:hypothetical protein
MGFFDEAARGAVLASAEWALETREGPIQAERKVVWVADYAFAASGSQMLILRVYGIRNRLSTKHTAGTAIG